MPWQGIDWGSVDLIYSIRYIRSSFAATTILMISCYTETYPKILSRILIL